MKSNLNKNPQEFSKELEALSFRAFKMAHINDSIDDYIRVANKKNKNKRNLKMNKVSPTIINVKCDEPETQFEAFQSAMKWLIIFGQCIALNPVQGILETDVANMRFTVFSWRFLHSIVIGISKSIAVVLCLYLLFVNSLSIDALSFLTFFVTTCATTFQFIHVGYKWPKLMKALSVCSLDEYVDKKIKRKCHVATVIMTGIGLFEHFLSSVPRVEHAVLCQTDAGIYKEYTKKLFPWYFALDVSFNVPVAVILQILNIIATTNLNYLDLYIICISMFLASILNKINTKIIATSEKHHVPSSQWQLLREDYNRATRLIRSFDDLISGLIFTSFAHNLFFICLQVFNIFAHGLRTENKNLTCQKNYHYGGYEYTVYIVFSTTYLIVRTLLMSLVAASVNTASMVPGPALYNVPASSFCDEVSRFITQVNEDKIALSGLQFFHVTRDLVLTVAGTIVTYELVLLQFSGTSN